MTVQHPNASSSSPQLAEDGLSVDAAFAAADQGPFDQVAWDQRAARITDEAGQVIFEQTNVDVPSDWSQLATNVVVSKYFYGDPEKGERESSVRELIHRVTRSIADWGKADGVFASPADAEQFYRELSWLCVNQYGSFNSPVWFNVGLGPVKGVRGGEAGFHWSYDRHAPEPTLDAYEFPQASACFIQSVDDSMEDIMRLAADEARLFKFGSGTGTDLSTIRSRQEKLSGGGTPSGPLSFMRIYDQIAAVVRSGGKTRRAAKMQSLRCDHPDIKEFITAKGNEERKAWALIEQGYDGSFNGNAYGSVMFQNANFSIRATDEFMQAALDDAEWQTYAVTTGEPLARHNARELLRLIAEGTHVCGDPGLQYHTTINRWHTCPESGPINASNPCSEYMFVDDSACNLASLNLMKFRTDDGGFDVTRFRSAVRTFLIAQEILVDHASYPSDRICRNSHDFRPLGLGYANLGALLMSLGLPYDSDEGRSVAAAVSSILTATAYETSAELASRLGSFPQYYRNRGAMRKVMTMHRDAVEAISREHCPAGLIDSARDCWRRAIEAGDRAGYRNAQVTVLAPTGTIGFMMDCDTTGIEPDIALVKYKQLAGGGVFKIVNRTVPLALARLGYGETQVAEIVHHIEEHDTIEGAAYLDPAHLPVFDCSFRPARGERSIHYMGHIRMMAAVQPFLSGAISKTVNMPTHATVEEIMQVYVDAWRLGLKAVAIYRDGSKRTQPLNLDRKKGAKAKREAEADARQADAISAEQLEAARRTPHRCRLPATRPSLTHKFDVAGHEGYINVGLYEDGRPGELFITMAKEGSTVGGMMDAFATAISLCLQYGVPLEALVKKFSHQRFEPSGMTSNRDIPFAKSIVDYLFRWLGMTFLEEFRKANELQRGRGSTPDKPAAPPAEGPSTPSSKTASEDVTEGFPSDPDGAEGISPTDGKRSTGALSGGLFAADEQAPVVRGSRQADPPQGAASRPKTASTAPGKATQRRDRFDQQFSHFQEDAPACDICGSITVRNGNCYKCFNCGSSLGCS